jgi:hypothetical protein
VLCRAADSVNTDPIDSLAAEYHNSKHHSDKAEWFVEWGQEVMALG